MGETSLDKLAAFLRNKYREAIGSATRTAEVLRLYEQHEDLSDNGFLQDFCSGNEEQFQQRLWEMSLSARLRSAGYRVTSSAKGPDFRVEVEGDVLWIEAISPCPGQGADRVPTQGQQIIRSPSNLPIVELLEDQVGVVKVRDIPSDKISLRWTQAIESKIKKFEGYRTDGIVAATDATVVAVNSGQLGRYSERGLSQYPLALEVSYGIGPQLVAINAKTGEGKCLGISRRAAVVKLNGASVRTTAFLDLDSGGKKLSAVLSGNYTDQELGAVPGRAPMSGEIA